jgi:biopolymer transport protein ExbD
MTIPSPRGQRKARIEIIPLIDIVFFLLATFVMVSLSMVKHKGIPVNLPAAVTGAPQEREDHVVITVAREGELFINKEPLKPDELPARLQRLLERQSDPKIFINGDEMAYLGQAVAVLDEVRRAGITKVAIETKTKD